jgi:hypothetical protein
MYIFQKPISIITASIQEAVNCNVMVNKAGSIACVDGALASLGNVT